MSLDLVEALSYHQAGDLDRARDAYNAILAERPSNPDALHLLGMLELQLGRAHEAEALIRRAVALCPKEASYRASLAEVCRVLGQNDDAISHCAAAMELQLENPELLCNVGATLLSLKRVEAGIN